MMPSTLRNEPIEKIEPNDPIDPMENAEPREPIERTEFLDQRLSTEFSDSYDITDLVPVLCRVLMRRVCHGVGVEAKSVDAKWSEVIDRGRPWRSGGPKWDLSPISKPHSTPCVSWLDRGPTRVRSTTPTRAQIEKASHMGRLSQLAVPVGFEFSSCPRPVLGETEIPPETGPL